MSAARRPSQSVDQACKTTSPSLWRRSSRDLAGSPHAPAQPPPRAQPMRIRPDTTRCTANLSASPLKWPPSYAPPSAKASQTKKRPRTSCRVAPFWGLAAQPSDMPRHDPPGNQTRGCPNNRRTVCLLTDSLCGMNRAKGTLDLAARRSPDPHRPDQPTWVQMRLRASAATLNSPGPVWPVECSALARCGSRARKPS